MSFLDTFKLYDRAMPDEQGNLQIIAECFYYLIGNFQTTNDGRVDCTNEHIPYIGEKTDGLVEIVIKENDSAVSFIKEGI